MSILIKGMEMPKDGCHHMICIYADGTVSTGGRAYMAIPVPPHGRLIDADAVKAAAMEDILGWEDAGCDRDDYRAFLANYIYDAPTIIPAEPPKEEAPTGPYDLLYEEGGPDA